MYKPSRPKDIKKLIVSYTKSKVPHFFIYAKDKERNKVAKINDSTVNRIHKIIKNKKMQFEEIDGIGKFDYKMLMSNSEKEIMISEQSRITNKVIKMYNILDTHSHFMINKNDKCLLEKTNESIIYDNIKKELLSIDCDLTSERITDILIEYLYNKKKSNFKVTLWECFGDVILNNLWNNIIEKEGLINPIQCVECGKIIEKINNKTKYCDDCKLYIANKQKNIFKYKQKAKNRKSF